MSLVPSLLQAIVKVDGEAMVMHAGDKPYVVSPTGQIELASRGLTLEAVSGIVGQLLPIEIQNALAEFGAIQYELPAPPEFPGEQFTVVAARGGDDVWVEIRRRRVTDDDRVPEEFFTSASAQLAPGPIEVDTPPPPAQRQSPMPEPFTAAPVLSAPPPAPAPMSSAQADAEFDDAISAIDEPRIVETPRGVAAVAAARDEAVGVNDDLLLPDATQLWPARPQREVAESIPPAADTSYAARVEDDFGEEIDVDLDEPMEPAEPQWQPPALVPAAPVAPPIMNVASRVVSATPAMLTPPPAVLPPPEVMAPVAAVMSPPPTARVRETPVAKAPRIAADPPAAVHKPQHEVAPPTPQAYEPPPAIVEPPAPQAYERPPAVVEPPAPHAYARPAAHVYDPPPVVVEPPAAHVYDPPLAIAAPPAAHAYEPPAPQAYEPPPAIVEPLAPHAYEPPPVDVEPPAAHVYDPPPVVEPPAAHASEPSAPHAYEPPPAIVEPPATHAYEPPPVDVEPPAAHVYDPPPAVVEPPAAHASEPPAPHAYEPPPFIVEPPESHAHAAEAHVYDLPSIVIEPPAAHAYEPPPVDVEPPAAHDYDPPPVVVEPLAAHAYEPPAPHAYEPPAAIVEPPESHEHAAEAHVYDLPPTVIEPPGPSAVEPVVPMLAAPRAVPPQIEPLPPAVVLQISRNPIRAEAPPPLVSDPTLSGLERLLRVSSARGASTLYLSSESRPSVRVDGELQTLDGEPIHTPRDVESLLLTLMSERSHEALGTGAPTEWICDIDGVGRVRCMSFRDHRGPGGVFRLMPTRSASVEQLGLPKHVQSLAIQPEGLILVAGPRSSGKRTLMAALVDLMNRTRRDHIITIEREINIVHERASSLVSQREVRGSDEDILAAARSALREDPDVLVIEDLRTVGLMNVALEAAASGRLVVGGFSAHTATGTIDRIIDLYESDDRRQVQFALADSLRGVIVQVLLRKVGGGRLPAREVLLNTPAVSSVIAEGKTSQLPMAIEGGRRYGMMPMNDALVGLVQNGTVDARDAYRQSADRPGFLAALNRQGIDTSFAERLA